MALSVQIESEIYKKISELRRLHPDGYKIGQTDILVRFVNIANRSPFSENEMFANFILELMNKLLTEDSEWAEFIAAQSSDGTRTDCETPVNQYINSKLLKSGLDFHKELAYIVGLKEYFAKTQGFYYSANQENIEITSGMACLFLSGTDSRKKKISSVPITGYNNYDARLITANEEYALKNLFINHQNDKKPIDKLIEGNFLYNENGLLHVNHSRLQEAICDGLEKIGIDNELKKVKILFDENNLLDMKKFFLDDYYLIIKNSFADLKNYRGNLLALKGYIECYLIDQNDINNIIKKIALNHTLIKNNFNDINTKGILGCPGIKEKILNEIVNKLKDIPKLEGKSKLKTVLLDPVEKSLMKYIKNVNDFKKFISNFRDHLESFMKVLKKMDVKDLKEILAIKDKSNKKVFEYIFDDNNATKAFIELLEKLSAKDVIEILETQDKFGLPALKFNISKKLLNQISKKLLFDILKEKNQNGDTIIHTAWKCNSVVFVKEILDKIPQNLLLDILKEKNQNGFTPLELVINNEAMLQLIVNKMPNELIDNVWKINDDFPDIMLNAAIQSNNASFLEKILCKVDEKTIFNRLKKKDQSGNIMLHSIMISNRHKTLEKCINKLSNNSLSTLLKEKDKYGSSALHQVDGKDRMQPLKIILAKVCQNKLYHVLKINDRCSNTVIHEAIRLEDKDYFEMLINNLPDNLFFMLLDEKNGAGNTILHEAILYNNELFLKKLLHKISETSRLKFLKEKNDCGYTPIELAIKYEDKTCLKTILKNLCKKSLFEALKEKNEHGATLLDLVIKHKDLLKEILKIEDENTLKAVVVLNKKGYLDQDILDKLNKTESLASEILVRNSQKDINIFRDNLNKFTREIDSLHESKKNDARVFVKSCQKADKAFLLNGKDSEEFKQAKTNVKQSIKPLKKHRHKLWRIAATVLTSLTVVGAFIGATQALIQKCRGRNPDYLFMTQTKSAQKTEKVMSPFLCK